MSSIFVLSQTGEPLMPTCPAKGRLLLKKGKAVVTRIVPFTIQLCYEPKTFVTQPVKIGIDDGANTAGIAVVQRNQESQIVLFKGTVSLRGDVKVHLSNRKARRRLRNSRKKCRQPRTRRGDKTGFLPPSLQVRKENIVRVVKDLATLAPVTEMIWEEGKFDTHALVNPLVKGKGYQQGFDWGWENRKAAVLWRDEYVCQYCGVHCIPSGMIATVDHIIPKTCGGTDAFLNLVCACMECNQKKGSQTALEFGHPEVQGKTFAYPAHLQCGKRYIRENLERIAPVKSVFGFQTKAWRESLGLPKSHENDASAMSVQEGKFVSFSGSYRIQARRRRGDRYNKKHKTFLGFRHFDLVKWTQRNGETHLGTVRSLVPNRRIIKIRFPFNDNVGVSISRVSFVTRFRGVVYQPE